MKTLKIKKLYDDVIIPKQATSGSVGLDIRVRLDDIAHRTIEINRENGERREYIVIPPNGSVIVGTGIKCKIPDNHFMQISPRSSTGKKRLRLLNTVGNIDSDYLGEIKLMIQNDGHMPFVLEQNAKLFQGIILKYPQIEVKEVDELEQTERGEGGFGSTGS